MDNKAKLIGGGIGLVILGLLLGWLFDGSDRKMKRGLEEMRETTASLSDKIAALSAGAGENTAKIAELVTGQEQMATQLSEVQDGVGAQIADMQSGLAASTAALREDLSGQIEAATAAAAAAAAPVVTQTQPAPEAAPEPAKAPAPASDAPGVKPGQTAMLTDDLRLFVGRASAETQEVYAAVNGLTLQRFRQGYPVAVQTPGSLCTVTLDRVSGSGAAFGAACGADVAEPEGVAVGQTVVLDGLRVFVSRLDQTEGTAVVAVNGQRTQPIGYDDALDVKTAAGRCDLVLNNIDRGRAALALNCAD